MNTTGSESALSDFESTTLTQQNVAQRYPNVVKPADNLQVGSRHARAALPNRISACPPWLSSEKLEYYLRRRKEGGKGCLSGRKMTMNAQQ